jgi:hypothetical protein
MLRRITAALRGLPSTWWGLYLGHVRLRARIEPQVQEKPRPHDVLADSV